MRTDINISELYVEGKDDQCVIEALCGKYSVKQTFRVVDCNNDTKAINKFALSINENASKYKNVGIILDADLDLNARWESLKRIILETDNYYVPDELPSGGLVLSPDKGNKPTIGVWIMPNNMINGMLEDFVVLLAENDDDLLQAVDRSLDFVEKIGVQRYKSIHKAKARIHTFLSWQEDPGTPMGLAITKKYLDYTNKECSIFIEWINKLFNR